MGISNNFHIGNSSSAGPAILTAAVVTLVTEQVGFIKADSLASCAMHCLGKPRVVIARGASASRILPRLTVLLLQRGARLSFANLLKPPASSDQCCLPVSKCSSAHSNGINVNIAFTQLAVLEAQQYPQLGIFWRLSKATLIYIKKLTCCKPLNPPLIFAVQYYILTPCI